MLQQFKKRHFQQLFIIICAINICFANILVFGTSNLTIKGVVGSGNHSPSVLTVDPSGNPEILDVSSMQNFLISFKDYEKDSISYTITPESDGGSVTPVSGTINSGNFDSNSSATINFVYSAPSNPVGNKKITVTLNDGINITSHDINVHIY